MIFISIVCTYCVLLVISEVFTYFDFLSVLILNTFIYNRELNEVVLVFLLGLEVVETCIFWYYVQFIYNNINHPPPSPFLSQLNKSKG